MIRTVGHQLFITINYCYIIIYYTQYKLGRYRCDCSSYFLVCLVLAVSPVLAIKLVMFFKLLLTRDRSLFCVAMCLVNHNNLVTLNKPVNRFWTSRDLFLFLEVFEVNAGSEGGEHFRRPMPLLRGVYHRHRRPLSAFLLVPLASFRFSA